MATRPRWVVLAMRILALSALLWIAVVELVVADVSVLWRASALSWDNPTTQAIDELASQAVPYTDRQRDARDHVLGALTTSGRIVPRTWTIGAPCPAFDSRLTRSPPAA